MHFKNICAKKLFIFIYRFLLGRHKLAIDAYQKAHLLNENSDSETYYNMGMCYVFMKNFEKAKEYMNLSLQARVSQEAFEALAQIALARKNLHEAIIVYEKGCMCAINLNHIHIVNLFNLFNY
jgi:tetratricopeptide (TPR) repeat protein